MPKGEGFSKLDGEGKLFIFILADPETTFEAFRMVQMNKYKYLINFINLGTRFG